MKGLLKQRFKTRIEHFNKNLLLIVVGDTGSGKSYAAMNMCESCDPEFGIDRVVFTNKEFMALVKSNTLHKGNWVLFDEAGVSISSRDWFTKANKVIMYVLQTFRHKNLAVVFTVPDLSFVDSQARKLFHGFFEMKKINPVKKTSIGLYFRIQHNPRNNKTYYKYLRVQDKNEGTLAIKEVMFHLPSQKLVDAYEEKKIAFTTQMNENIHDDLSKETSISEVRKKEENFEDFAKEIVANPKLFRAKQKKDGSWFVDDSMISLVFRIGRIQAGKVRLLSEFALDNGGVFPELKPR
jgi:ABC-type dipeptide/oligopeptide/nickel transport system ATPase component